MQGLITALVVTVPIIGLVIYFAAKHGNSNADREYSYVPVDTKKNRVLDEINYRDQARYMNQMIDRMESDNANIKNRLNRD